MKRSWNMIGIALVLVLAASGAWADEKGTWVSDDGHAVALHAGHDMMFIGDEGGETFNLSDLRDGESRTFGEGDKEVTVTRTGDAVTIVRDARGDEKAIEINCSVDRDACQVITFEDDPEKVMIVVKKTRQCVDGAGDCEATVDVTLDHLGAMDGNQVHAIVRKIQCDDEGNCETFEDVHAGAPGMIKVIADIDAGNPHGNVMVFRSNEVTAGEIMLRCPEGDSTVHVEAEEADETFLCPKHSVPMEKVEMPQILREIHIEEAD